MAAIVPYGLIFISNILLIHITLKSKSKISNSHIRHTDSKHFHASTTVLISTTLFVICTGPVSIMRGYFSETYTLTPDTKLLLDFLLALRFTYQSCNLIMLIMFNTQFYNQFKKLLFTAKKKITSIKVESI